MSKKTETEYRWYKKIDKPHTNKKYIQNQIDSFMFYIENQDYIELNKYKDEFDPLPPWQPWMASGDP